ncbi:MAG: GNAT family N-acetyltransferase [Pseudochelatococcus sp.]|jgi:ribosomal protein S18 acetylase RimI-like enzyme|uniref:GNAT family N-acetyltransferase n=1 Tax=Pseudochelatococcus sp. TaxID=2020869 RepID=UPI003D9333BF
MMEPISFRPLQALRIRKLFSTDLPEYRAHLLRLDAQTRYNRFGTCVRDEFIESYAGGSFGDDALLFGYIENGEMRGAAEFRPYGKEDVRYAEVAFSVEEGWRRRGIGSALFEKLLVAARNRRTAQLVMHCLPDNRAMQKLAMQFNARLRQRRDERTGVILDLAPTPMSLAQEAADDWRAIAGAMIGIHRRVWGSQRPLIAGGQSSA